MKPGTKITTTTKSLHFGQSGTIVEDYGNMYLVKADYEKYEKAFTAEGREGKYFQVDARFCKEVVDAKDK